MTSRSIERYGVTYGGPRFGSPEPTLLSVSRPRARILRLTFDGVLLPYNHPDAGDNPEDPAAYAIEGVGTSSRPVHVELVTLIAESSVEVTSSDFTIFANYKMTIVGDLKFWDGSSAKGLEVTFRGMGDRPYLISAEPLSSRVVRAKFSEPMKETSSLLDPSEYRFEGYSTLTPISVAKTLPTMVDEVDILTAEAQVPGQIYTLFVGEEVADSALPLLKYVNTTRIEIRRRYFLEGRGELAKYTLQDGKTRILNSIYVDFATSGIGGLDIGIKAVSTNYRIFLVPDPTDDDILAGVLSLNEATVGPDTSIGHDGSFLYVGHCRNTNGNTLRRFYHAPNEGSFYFPERDEADLTWYQRMGAADPPTATWYTSESDTAPGGSSKGTQKKLSKIVCMPEVDEVLVQVGIDADLGSDYYFAIEPDASLYNSGTWPQALARSVNAALDEDRNPAQRWVPLNESGAFYFTWFRGTGVEWSMIVLGVKDRYLR